MKKVAFYLENKDTASVDCSNILNGNPGIGGTQYMITVVSYMLQRRSNGIAVNVYAQTKAAFPEDYEYETVSGFTEACRLAAEAGCEYFVFRHDASLITDHVLDGVSGMKLVVWDHVFACYWELDYYASHPCIYKIINVGREMTDLYRDHKVYVKSSYIYNCINTAGVKELVAKYPVNNRANIVTYIGSIVPFKGFHLLAEAWPEILSAVPDAELYVIGSGRLYDENSVLGRFGIAEASYEKQFMKYLTKEGRILPGVHFMGIMGQGKRDILLKTKVGVPNPSGITETFCLSAVEMQLYGAKVATIRYPGYLDTVKNGILYSRKKDLAKTVIRLLNDNSNDYDSAMASFEQDFSYETVVSRWETFFLTGDVPADKSMSNPWFRLKWLKELKRKLCGIVPVLYGLPPIERCLIFIERKILGKKTYIDS